MTLPKLNHEYCLIDYYITAEENRKIYWSKRCMNNKSEMDFNYPNSLLNVNGLS